MEMKTRQRSCFSLYTTLGVLLLAVASSVILAGCSSRIGWGLVLWTVKGTSAKAGTIVPVYLKSNITKVYVIGLESEGDARIEIPLWQMEMHSSKSAAQASVKKLGDLASLYLVAERDGLPVRAEASNTSDRVYRLRNSEMVKILERAEGEIPSTGGTKLPGEWYKVMTMGGSIGYVFSYAMWLYDEKTGNSPVEAKIQGDPEFMNSIFSRTWRPAWFSAMILEDIIDLDYFALRFGLFGDAKNRQIRIETPGISKVFQYTTITQDKEWLVFGSTELRIRFENPRSLLASWGGTMDGNPADTAGWKSGDTFMRFVALDEDIRDIIRTEEARRSADLRNFFSATTAISETILDNAGVFRCSSPTGGTFSVWPSGLYSWIDRGTQPAGFAPSDRGEDEQKGNAVFGLKLSRDLSLLWHGGFSLYPESTGLRADYVYRIDGKGIILAKAVPAAPASPVREVEKRLGTIVFSFARR
jgi:hypothetical protein